MEVMGQNKILGEGWTLLDKRGARMKEERRRITGSEEGRDGWVGASSPNGDHREDDSRYS